MRRNALATLSVLATIALLPGSWAKGQDEYSDGMVEHDMQVVMGICQRVAVLDYGIKIAEDTPSKIRSDPKVCEAYLGQPANP